MTIQTDRFSEKLRAIAVETESRRLRITRLGGSTQEADMTLSSNCKGLGRIRHFRRSTSAGWPPNPLPIDPAARALGLAPPEMLRAQVFQNAVCNWRCWYCFVPFELLKGDPKRSVMVTTDELVALYLNEPDRPSVIDLSGGQPDIVPEWVPWMMKSLADAQLEHSTYLWSDDNLSNDYFWRYLSDAEIEQVESYTNYGKVCCFKGYDEESFAFNTNAEPEIFSRQFDLFARYAKLDLDLYAYATFTGPATDRTADNIRRFVDRLQSIHPNLPLRVVPLEVATFSAMEGRIGPSRREAIAQQQSAIDSWLTELDSRFSETLRTAPITEIPLR